MVQVHGVEEHPLTQTVPSPDLLGGITDLCIADCDDGPVRVSVQVENQGGSLSAATPTLAARVRELAGVSWSKARTLCEGGRVSVDGVVQSDPTIPLVNDRREPQVEVDLQKQIIELEEETVR